eukprot:8284581-Pyramimonas_sp.AAC.1
MPGRLGPGTTCFKSVRTLNRVVERGRDGSLHEAGQKHVEVCIRELGLVQDKAIHDVPAGNSNPKKKTILPTKSCNREITSFGGQCELSSAKPLGYAILSQGACALYNSPGPGSMGKPCNRITPTTAAGGGHQDLYRNVPRSPPHGLTSAMLVVRTHVSRQAEEQ